jgi:hypothetical protein
MGEVAGPEALARLYAVASHTKVIAIIVREDLAASFHWRSARSPFSQETVQRREIFRGYPRRLCV